MFTRISCMLLVAVQIGTTTLESHLAVASKAEYMNV